VRIPGSWTDTSQWTCKGQIVVLVGNACGAMPHQGIDVKLTPAVKYWRPGEIHFIAKFLEGDLVSSLEQHETLKIDLPLKPHHTLVELPKFLSQVFARDEPVL